MPEGLGFFKNARSTLAIVDCSGGRYMGAATRYECVVAILNVRSRADIITGRGL